MKLYSDEMIDSLINKKKNGIKMMIFPLFLAIQLLLFFMIVVKLKTKILYVCLSTLDLSIYAIIFVYSLLEMIIRSNDLIRHISNMLNGNKAKISGTITKISNVITLQRNIHIVEVEIKDNDVHKVYFNVDLFNVNFEVGSKIDAEISNNFITEYEVKYEKQ